MAGFLSPIIHSNLDQPIQTIYKTKQKFHTLIFNTYATNGTA